MDSAARAWMRSWRAATEALDAASDGWTPYGGGAFRGAEPNRLYADRIGAIQSPNSEIRYSLQALRARARDLVRNNAYAAGVVEAFADNVVGWEGIQCKPRVTSGLGMKESPVRAVNWAIEKAWKEWGEEHASVDGVESWHEIERLIVKSWATDGEVFIRRRKGWDNPFGFAVEMIDPDQLDENFNESRARQGREIVMGVELDTNGRHVAYHFWKQHPDFIGRRERVRIPAEEITHFFVRYRPGQTRGYSLFAPVLTTVEMIDGLTEAELVASRYHASKMGFITNNDPQAIAAYAVRLKLQSEKGDVPPKRKIAPGIVEELHPGQEFESFDPNHPNTAFEAFLRTMLHGVARGFGMSYLTYSGDVSQSNYSSQRGSLPPERDHWKAVQNILSRRVHRPVYRDFMASALLTGALVLPSPVASDYYAVEWRGRRWEWVDPVDDIAAKKEQLSVGITSRQRLAAELGHDYEEIVDELAEEEAYAKALGVDVSGGGTKPLDRSPRAPGNGNGKENGNGGGKVNRLAPFVPEGAHGD